MTVEQGNRSVEQDEWKNKVVEQGGGKKNNTNNPIKILASGKVVGNVGEQRKEVRDNCVKNKANPVEDTTGKEIVPVKQSTGQCI